MRVGIQDEISRLKAHIAKGNELAAQGHDVGFLQAINLKILHELEAQANGGDGDAQNQANIDLAGGGATRKHRATKPGSI